MVSRNQKKSDHPAAVFYFAPNTANTVTSFFMCVTFVPHGPRISLWRLKLSVEAVFDYWRTELLKPLLKTLKVGPNSLFV